LIIQKTKSTPMKDRIYIAIFILATTALIFNSCSKDEETITPDPQPQVMTARDSAVQDYNTNFLGSAITNIGWTGNTTTCTAGTVSASSDAAVIKRINYFRRMVGLNDNCTLDPSLNSQEQEAALMMTANNSLSHNPPTTWSCYTQAGHDGAASSNLASGTNSSDAIWAFINDYGSGNTAVGHRRWILHSRKQRFCYGSTTSAMALYVFFTDTNTHVPSFVAYPPKGYVPQQLLSSRWSFSIPNADFSASTVMMTGPSGNVPLTVVSSTANGYGDNTIVWEPIGISTTSTSDVVYTVTVSGIASDVQTTYTYNTTIFKP
jgi:hypothetical protein